jgi:hypothetical protein
MPLKSGFPAPVYQSGPVAPHENIVRYKSGLGARKLRSYFIVLGHI